MDGAFALAGREGEASARGCGGECGACAAHVPGAAADDAAFGAAAVCGGEGAFAGKGGSGGGRRGWGVCRGGRGGGGGRAGFGEVFDACGRTRGF